MTNESMPAKEMPKFRCHKTVWALKLAKVTVLSDAIILYPDDVTFGPIEKQLEWRARVPETDDPGYYVVYDNGYSSWSPTHVFEAGYDRIPERIAPKHRILEHFSYAHLPGPLQSVSRPFCEMADELDCRYAGAETTVAMRKLLEAKDAAVRAARVEARWEGTWPKENPKFSIDLASDTPSGG